MLSVAYFVSQKASSYLLLAGSQVYKMAGETAPPPEQRAVYQAEDASIYHSAVENNHAGYTGAGFVNFDNETGSYVTFCVDVSGDGDRSLLMRFANGSHAGRYMDININGRGIEHDNVAFDPTGAWTSWGYQSVNVYLQDGGNTIQIISDQSFGGPNLDKIELGVPGVQSSAAWYSTPGFSGVHDLGAGNTGTVTLEFDVTPFGNAIDGVIGYADTDTPISTWSSMAMLVRMYQNGKFEVRKEDIYTADKDVYYSADTKYHVAVSADMSTSTYDVWVTPEGRCRTRIAHDFPFRSDAPATDDVGKVCLIGDTQQNFKVENHIVW